MFKAVKTAIALAVAALSFQTLAYGADLPVWYGVKQKCFKFRDVYGPKYYVESDCDWSAVGTTRALALIASRAAVPKGSDVPSNAVGAAASVLDFTEVDSRGLNINYLGSVFSKERAGRIFKDTTDPILRVEYRDINFPKVKLYKTLGTQSGYGQDALLNLGISPGTCKILRFAVVVRPQINKLIDDYGYATVSKMQYHEFLDPSRDIDHPLTVSLTERQDDGSDPLLNF